MAKRVPVEISVDDLALLAPLTIAAAGEHEAALSPFMTPKFGPSWLADLSGRQDAFGDAIEHLAMEKRETRDLTDQVVAILGKLPGWKQHILSLADLAYGAHAKHDQFISDLGRGQQLNVHSIGPARSYLQAVLPHVKAHRQALIDAGGSESTIDQGQAWADQLQELKVEDAREKSEDAEAGAAVSEAFDKLLEGLNWVVGSANAAEYENPEAEEAVVKALEEGYRKIRLRSRDTGGDDDASSSEARATNTGASEAGVTDTGGSASDTDSG